MEALLRIDTVFKEMVSETLVILNGASNSEWAKYGAAYGQGIYASSQF